TCPTVPPLAACRCPPLFCFTAPPPTEIYTLSLHDALPISGTARPAACAWSAWQRPWPPCCAGDLRQWRACPCRTRGRPRAAARRSEEHTSELQSRENLVCRLLLEKKKKKRTN